MNRAGLEVSSFVHLHHRVQDFALCNFTQAQKHHSSPSIQIPKRLEYWNLIIYIVLSSYLYLVIYHTFRLILNTKQYQTIRFQYSSFFPRFQANFTLLLLTPLMTIVIQTLDLTCKNVIINAVGWENITTTRQLARQGWLMSQKLCNNWRLL